MITVCIAAYRYDADPLLKSLQGALRLGGECIRVVLADDSSGEPWTGLYDTLAQQFGIEVVRPEENLGRVGIRNLLAEKAESDWLLFLDVDSVIPDLDFICRYKEAAKQADVVAGGTLYTTDQEGAGSLRHRYGLAREMVPATKRNQAPYARLALNNLFIRRQTFLDAGGLDTAIQGYGHEDTLLGRQLERIGAGILHIDNPVLHTGLEDDATFIAKSEEGARNLAQLYHAGKLGAQDARLISAGLTVKQLGLGWLVSLLAGLYPTPSLRGLDIRKLAAFVAELRR